METVTVSEAKATLSRLVQRVLGGETIAIGRRGRSEVVLTALHHDPTPRPLGTWGSESGAEFWMADDFDDPLPEVEEDFSAGVLSPR